MQDDVTSPPLGLDINPSSTTTHVGSIADRDLVTSLFAQNPSIRHILHTATLHKPHIESHSKDAFVETNVQGTVELLEAAGRLGGRIESFVFVSTTSTFGRALCPAKGAPPRGSTSPSPRAEKHLRRDQSGGRGRVPPRPYPDGLARRRAPHEPFFQEADDDKERRDALENDNLKLLELCYRRADIADLVSACVCAMTRAKELRWARYIISAPSPLVKDEATLALLNENAADAVEAHVPGCKKVFEDAGWGWLDRIDRVLYTRYDF
ncbi:unnamed protein product [Parascedosporium putredinis]|uniref:NAD-dependent epimerase/dehydratase domain-containing protein n=1 Tax=Parascedosporium putredinis TaxID=1442378 RepID=A0A9P1HAY2_9PEZI|nr:unnamed protein product [Parascedosporium putredinis]CAI8004982.1 unnamed protein product [Parascedosporium putredinis]